MTDKPNPARKQRPGLRIVMLTDDVQIDRRILQEAESLIDQGHEVILYSAPQPGHDDHEIVGRVKVSRIGGNEATRAQIKIANFHNKLVNVLNRVSIKTQAIFARVLTRLEAERVKVITRFKKDLLLPLLVVVRKLLTLSLWLITRTALTSHKVTTKLGAHAARLSPLAPRDQQILNEIRFHRPDVIHAHDYPQITLALAAKKALGVPVIYDAHEMYPQIGTLTPQQQTRYAKVEKRIAPKLDAHITVNPHIARELAKQWGTKEPVVVLNAIDPPQDFDPNERHDRFRQTLDIPQDRTIVLFQGWMSNTRGLDELVQGFGLLLKQRDDIHLVMMGYGDHRDALRALADQLEIAHRVSVIDAVPQDELIFWTASADVGVIPYRPIDNNFLYCSPNKMFEFVQARLPVVANDLPYLRDFIVGNNTGLVADTNTPEGVCAGLAEMLDQTKGGPDRFRTGLDNTAYLASWQCEQHKLFTVYESLFPGSIQRTAQSASTNHQEPKPQSQQTPALA